MIRAAIFALIALVACANTPTPSTTRDPPIFIEALTLALAPTGDDLGGARDQVFAFLGREDLIVGRERSVCQPLLRDGATVDPIQEIVRLSAGRRIVILNEAHDHPQHRAFISDVASALRREGFGLYAAETFAPMIREQWTWPRRRDGYYTSEPAFGALMRRARADGFRFFDYEHIAPGDEKAPADGDWAPRIARREAGQAANLQAVLNENPNDRLFIHVGYGHLQELPDETGNRFMAERLKEATGIDPLTVDLTRYASPTDAFVFCDPAQTPARTVDFRVGTPAMRLIDGRAAWRQEAGQRAMFVPAMANPTTPTIWEARRANEPEDAVAVDRVLVRQGEHLPLLLAPGRYRVESWAEAPGWSAPFEVNVD